MDKRWRVSASRLLFEGRPHRLRLDDCVTPRGVEVRDYFVREVADIAMVFALTARRQAVLVRQYRHGVAEETLELPQGLLEPGEDPEAGAARELREETGYEADRLRPAGELWASPAVQTSRVFLFVAVPARDGGRRAPEPEEDLDVVHVPVEELEARIERGEIRAAASVAGIYLGLRWLERRS